MKIRTFTRYDWDQATNKVNQTRETNEVQEVTFIELGMVRGYTVSGIHQVFPSTEHHPTCE